MPGAQWLPRRLGEGGRGSEFRQASRMAGSRTQNIENNPMQSSLAVAGMRDPAKTV